MVAFLVFQLKAPLASFGNNQGLERTSDTVPRKSTIYGMFAAAFGVVRSNTPTFQNIVNDLRMAVCTVRQPIKMVDFHTVQAPVHRYAASRAEQVKDILEKQMSKGGYSGSIVTRREYLQDGHWVVAIAARLEYLQRLQHALEFPEFTLYVGRKSCVLSCALAPLIFEANDVEEAVSRWSSEVGVELPAEAPLHWDVNVPVRAAPLASLRIADVRRRLDLNHFSSRDVLNGTAHFAEAACISPN